MPRTAAPAPTGRAAAAEAHARLARVVDLLAARAEEADRETGFPYAQVEEVHRAGLLTLTTHRRYGGPGAGLAETVRVLTALGRGDPSVALITAMTLIVHAVQAREGGWPEDLYAEVLAESRTGPVLVNALRAEPELGTPARGGLPATVARRTEDGWRVSGHKVFCTGSEGLAWMLVWARTDEPRPRTGTFLVRGDSPGAEVVPTWNHLGLRASAGHDVVLRDALVREDAVIGLAPADGSPESGPDTARTWSNLAVPAVYLGVAQAARDWLVRFLHERTPSALGRPLATLERFHTAVGEIETKLIGAEELITSLAKRVDQGQGEAHEAAPRTGPAKLLASRAAVESVELAVSLVGNPGLTFANPLQRHLRDVLCARVHTPQDDSVLTTAGRAALARHRRPRRDPVPAAAPAD